MEPFTIQNTAHNIASNALEDMRKALGRGGAAHLPGETQAQFAIADWLLRCQDISLMIALDAGNGPVREMPATTPHPMANELERLKATVAALKTPEAEIESLQSAEVQP